MSSVVKGVKGVVKGLTGQTAADATAKGAKVSAVAQQAGLDYLKESERLPMQYRDESMAALAGLHGLEGGTEGAYEMLQQTPMYQAVMSGQGAAEESILRNANAIGQGRGGDVRTSLAENTQNLRNQALMQSMQGLQGFAGQPSNAGTIAQQMGNIGMTQAQGVTGAAQAEQAGLGNLAQIGIGVGGLFSDVRLKDNVKEAGEINGHKWYSWDWNNKAADLGLSGSSEGVMAHEVAEYMPDAVGTKGDYLTVDYSMLGASH